MIKNQANFRYDLSEQAVEQANRCYLQLIDIYKDNKELVSKYSKHIEYNCDLLTALAKCRAHFSNDEYEKEELKRIYDEHTYKVNKLKNL